MIIQIPQGTTVVVTAPYVGPNIYNANYINSHNPANFFEFTPYTEGTNDFSSPTYDLPPGWVLHVVGETAEALTVAITIPSDEPITGGVGLSGFDFFRAGSDRHFAVDFQVTDNPRGTSLAQIPQGSAQTFDLPFVSYNYGSPYIELSFPSTNYLEDDDFQDTLPHTFVANGTPPPTGWHLVLVSENPGVSVTVRVTPAPNAGITTNAAYNVFVRRPDGKMYEGYFDVSTAVVTGRAIPPSVAAPNNVRSAAHGGQISSARWRGPRGSAPLLAALETLIADIAALARVAARLNPFGTRSTLIPSIPVVDYFGVTEAQPSDDRYVASVAYLGPQIAQAHTVRLQSLRAQCVYRLQAP